MDTKNIVHIKANCNGQFRRFASPPVYEKLMELVRTMYSIPANVNFGLKYQDQDNDLCTITTQLELDFATQFNPLKLMVVPTKPELSRPERLEAGLAWVNTKLAQPNLPEEKVQALTQKRAVLQARLDQLQGASTEPERLEKRLACINAQLARPGLLPAKIQTLNARREALSAKLPIIRTTFQWSAHVGPISPLAPVSPDLSPVTETQQTRLENRLAWINAQLERSDLTALRREALQSRKQMILVKIDYWKNQPKNGGPRGNGLQSRLACLEARLAQPGLSSEQIEDLKKKRGFVQEKIAQQEAKKKLEETAPRDETSNEVVAQQQLDRLRQRLDSIHSELSAPHLDDATVLRLMQKKERLEQVIAKRSAARESVDGAKAVSGASLQRKCPRARFTVQKM